jgi:signal transduction histidine kinase
LTSVVREHCVRGAALSAARERARAAHVIAGGGLDGAAVTSAAFVGAAIVASAGSRTWSAREVALLLDDVAAVGGPDAASDALGALAFASALRSTASLGLPPRAAVELQLTVLTGFADVREASLWLSDDGGGLRCWVLVGPPSASRRVRRLAVETLSGADPAPGLGGALHGVPVALTDGARAALIVRVRPKARERALAFAAESALALAPLVEQEALLDRAALRERVAGEAGERRLTRLGFDLHDGPLQDIAALTADLRLMRTQIEAAPAGVIEGRIDDALGLLASVERDVRELARSLESTTSAGGPFADLVQREADRADLDGIAVSISVTGDVDACTPSQRIALLRVVQEALSNIRRHSGATSASVAVAAGATILRAEIVDRGRGFDLDRALVDGARAGRMGLLGMSERIRLLGGTLDVASRIGGPTTVRATIPRWRPSS